MSDVPPEETLFRFVTVRTPVVALSTKTPYSIVESGAITPFHRTMLGLGSLEEDDYVGVAKEYMASNDYVTRLGPADLENTVRHIGTLPDDEFIEETVNRVLTQLLGMPVADFVAGDTTKIRGAALWDSLYAASVLGEARDADQIVDSLQVLNLLKVAARDQTIMGDRERWGDALSVTPMLPNDAFSYLTKAAARLPTPSTAEAAPIMARSFDSLRKDINQLESAIHELERLERTRLRQAEQRQSESEFARVTARLTDNGDVGERLDEQLDSSSPSADFGGEPTHLAPWRPSLKDISALSANTRSALDEISIDLEYTSIPEAVEFLEIEKIQKTTALYSIKSSEQICKVGDVMLSVDDFPDTSGFGKE